MIYDIPIKGHYALSWHNDLSIDKNDYTCVDPSKTKKALEDFYKFPSEEMEILLTNSEFLINSEECDVIDSWCQDWEIHFVNDTFYFRVDVDRDTYMMLKLAMP